MASSLPGSLAAAGGCAAASADATTATAPAATAASAIARSRARRTLAPVRSLRSTAEDLQGRGIVPGVYPRPRGMLRDAARRVQVAGPDRADGVRPRAAPAREP